jgi:glycosyltransferase involved in cell wall biosynthesis
MLVFVQRVLSDYRTPLFRACQQKLGKVVVFHHRNRSFAKVKEPKSSDLERRQFRNWMPRFLEKIGVFFNPRLAVQVARQQADLVVLEGESNLANNLLIAPLLIMRRQPYIWWTLGRPTTVGVSWRRRLFWPVIRWMMERAVRVACYSTAGKSYLINRGLEPDRIMILHNALDPNLVHAQDTENREQAVELVEQKQWQDRLRLTYVGAMTADKRPALLVEAAARYQQQTGRPVGLFFVGEGPELEGCRRRAAELGTDAIFTGRKPLSEAGTYILAGDAVVVPGLGGLAINHAMMLGRPVICGRADGTERDLVIDGKTGLYLDPLDADSLLEGLITLQRDPPLAQRMGDNAREHIRRTATIDSIVQRLAEQGKSASRPLVKAA